MVRCDILLLVAADLYFAYLNGCEYCFAKSFEKAGGTMGNVMDYLKWRGDLTFAQDPFNEVDNLLLSYVAYVNLDGLSVGAGEEKVTLEELSRRFFVLHSETELEADKSFTRVAPYILKQMAESNRYRTAEVSNYVNMVNPKLEMQFSAAQVDLPDGTVNFCFRGTDDNIVAWKEDFNLSLGEVPAQRLAAEYLNRFGTGSEPIRLSGHSKGGNLAVFAAAACDPHVQEKITDVYCNDGPGFIHEFVSGEEYKRIQGRIHRYIPDSSIIGMLLENPVKPHVIKSSGKGILQHDAISWQIEGPCFVPETLSESATMLHETLHRWLDNIDESGREQFVNDLFSILESTGVETLTQVQEGGLKNAATMLRELHQIVPGTWSELENLLKAVLPFSGFVIMGRQKSVEKQATTERQSSIREIASNYKTVLAGLRNSNNNNEKNSEKKNEKNTEIIQEEKNK